LLEPLGFEAVPQGELGVGEAEEPHDTFVENALAKARHASAKTGLPALADDSGLCVKALGGEPGVHSAYFAGLEGDRVERDSRNNAKLAAALKDVADRTAFYYCVLVLVRSARDPTPLIADGDWHGEITLAPRGAHGFGYDPHFVTVFGKTAAQMPPEAKNRVSHRARAMAALTARLVGTADPTPRP